MVALIQPGQSLAKIGNWRCQPAAPPTLIWTLEEGSRLFGKRYIVGGMTLAGRRLVMVHCQLLGSEVSDRLQHGKSGVVVCALDAPYEVAVQEDCSTPRGHRAHRSVSQPLPRPRASNHRQRRRAAGSSLLLCPGRQELVTSGDGVPEGPLAFRGIARSASQGMGGCGLSGQASPPEEGASPALRPVQSRAATRPAVGRWRLRPWRFPPSA